MGQPGVVSARLYEISFDKNHNNLHLGIRKDDKNIYFPELELNTLVLCLSKQREALLSDSDPCLCCTVVIVDSDLPKPCRPGCPETIIAKPCGNTAPIMLFCSAQFLAHYKYADREKLFVCYVCPPSLSKVSLKALTPQAFQWAMSQNFSTGLLVSVCNQDKVLARKNDYLCAFHSTLFDQDIDIFSEFTVLDTEPFQQGYITLKTEFVILNGSEQIESNLLEKSKEGSIKQPDSSSPIHVSDFAVPLTSVFMQRASSKPSFRVGTSHVASLQRDWNILPYELDNGSLDRLCNNGENRALGFSLYVTLNTAKKFGLFNESLLEIKLDGEQKRLHSLSDIENPRTFQANDPKRERSKVHKSSSKTLLPSSRVVFVNVLTDSQARLLLREKEDQEQFYMSLPLWFNLTRDKAERLCTIKKAQQLKFRKYQSTKDYVSSASVSRQGNLPYARELHVSCVYSPSYSTGAPYSQSLKAFFSQPRLLRSGDIFAVDTKVDPEFGQVTEGSSKSQPLVYFRVNKIGPKTSKAATYVADSEHSALYQVKDSLKSFYYIKLKGGSTSDMVQIA